MDRFGRRTLLLWGSLFMAASHIIIAGLVGEGQKDWTTHGGMGWTAVAFLLIYMIAFGARLVSAAKKAYPCVTDDNQLGTSTMGSPQRDLPILTQSQGSSTIHMFKLAQQFVSPFPLTPSTALQELTSQPSIIGLITPPLISGTKNYGAYIFFAAFCVFSGIWVFFCVPETNGKSLEEMDHVFRDAGGSEEEEIRKLRIERELAASTQALTVA